MTLHDIRTRHESMNGEFFRSSRSRDCRLWPVTYPVVHRSMFVQSAPNNGTRMFTVYRFNYVTGTISPVSTVGQYDSLLAAKASVWASD